MSRASSRDLKLLARNSAEKLTALERRGQSLAVCFDALLAVIEIVMPGTVDKLKAELERRAKL